MALYETIFILDSLLPPEDIDKQVDSFKDLLESNNCKVVEIDRWGKKRLAYEIQKKQYGYYVSIEFESDGKAPQILNNEFNYNDKVLRYMTYRFDKNKLKDRTKRKSKAAKLAKETEQSKDKVSETVVPEVKEEVKAMPEEVENEQTKE